MLAEGAIKIYGIDCAACVANLQKRIRAVKGVGETRINPVLEKVSVSYDNDIVCINDIMRCIRRSGYNCELWTDAMETDDQSRSRKERSDMLKLLIISTFLTMPLVWNPAPFIQMALAAIIQLWPGRVFYRGTYRALRNKMLNMDCLIAASTTIIFVYSAYSALTVHSAVQLYFMGDGILVSIILFGRYMETVVRADAGRSVQSLLRMQPVMVRTVNGGLIKEVSIRDVSEGDSIIINAGERIPVDGIIRSGQCTADESMLTGESSRILKKTGDHIYGGTYDCEGTVTAETENTGYRSMLRQIIAIMQKAQMSKAPVQRFADRTASWFIPAVALAAFITFCFWYIHDQGQISHALMAMCGVLVIACPCALGLATPVGIMVGTGRAAEDGILFRGGMQLENADRITDIVFDKTGTLTRKGTNEIREDAAQAVSALKDKGYCLWIFSGDSEEKAAEIASGLHIENVYADMTPQQKEEKIRELQRSGKKVAMTGDGINDAPALSASDLAIAVGSGTDVAIEASDVILLNDSLSSVIRIFDIAKSTMKVIHQNLLWAFMYNAVCIPLAAAGIINPSIASAAMSGSSIVVLMHSLKLKRK